MGNSADGMADLSGAAAAPVRQRLQGCGGGEPGVEGRLEEARRIQADQPEAAEEPDGTIRMKLAPEHSYVLTLPAVCREKSCAFH